MPRKPRQAPHAHTMPPNGLTAHEAAEVVAVQAHLPPGFGVAFGHCPHSGGMVAQLVARGRVVAAVVRLNGRLAVLDFQNALQGASAVCRDIGEAVASIRLAFCSPEGGWRN